MCVLLGIYSHMIDSFLYLPDYPDRPPDRVPDRGADEKGGTDRGRVRAHGEDGRVTPDLWMKHATGKPVGAEALLEATQKALAAAGSSH